MKSLFAMLFSALMMVGIAGCDDNNMEDAADNLGDAVEDMGDAAEDACEEATDENC
ncbi:hypothetical protein [Parahaliea mediterranea]|uniref:hypothetical protein n=1 Tax=Parahaliea mediterranea TaxID=651086 RepID=UPI00147506D1|nr:hypothetical protein [Parahaliea mediterranea]